MAQLYYEIPHAKWLRENVDKSKTNRELLNAFNLEFNFNLEPANFRTILRKFNIERKSGYKKRMKQKQALWLKENAYKYNDYNILVNDFNNIFNTDFSSLKIKEFCESNGIKKQNLYNQWNENQLDFLRNNIEKHETFEELRVIFNQHFNKKIKIEAIKAVCERYNIHKKDRKSLNRYNKEIEKYILDNKEKYTNKELSIKVNEIFGLKTTQDGIESFLQNRNALRENKHYRMQEKKKIGEEIIKDKHVYVKIKDDYYGSNPNDYRKNWRKKSHILYEQYHNVKINDEKQIVVHIDNNNFNFEKDNLVLLEKEVARTYNSKKSAYSFSGLKYNKILIQVSQLEHIIKNERKDNEK